ncbi:MAG: hypothetical protein JNK60_03685 [Acidobacteria bacterium]|nr:hypothetical protein [Acidobacteriota bacterium]
MPNKVIPMTAVWIAGRALAGGAPSTVLPGGIQVLLEGGRLEIRERGKTVFSMKKCSAKGANLVIDYPHTIEGQEGRGWGILAMLIALYYGLSSGCTNIELGSQIENTHASTSFWGKFGIANMLHNSLHGALDHGIRWVLTNCPQRAPEYTDLVIRQGHG